LVLLRGILFLTFSVNKKTYACVNTHE
jgi:hypothetical protein